MTMPFSQLAQATNKHTSKARGWKSAMSLTTALALTQGIRGVYAQQGKNVDPFNFKKAIEHVPGLGRLNTTALDTSEFDALFEEVNHHQGRSLNRIESGLTDISLDKKMVIIGGGPAGIDMARRLDNLGFKDVTVLEARSELGGKSRTADFHGVKYDMGTVFMLGNTTNYRSFIELLKEYNVDSRVPKADSKFISESAGCALAPSHPFCAYLPLDLGSLIIGHALHVKPELLQEVAPELLVNHIVGLLIGEMTTYVQLYFEIFGASPNYILPDKPADFDAIDMSASEFLDKHELEIMRPIAHYLQTAQGYGYLEEIPAFYMFRWFNPPFAQSLIKLLTGQADTSNPDEVSAVLKDGFQIVWETIAKTHEFDVITEFKVNNIKRIECDKKSSKGSKSKKGKGKGKKTDYRFEVTGKQSRKGRSRTRTIKADYVFVATPMQYFLDIMDNPTEQEEDIFQNLSSSTWNTYIVKANSVTGLPAYAVDLDQMYSDLDIQLEGKPWWIGNKQAELEASDPTLSDHGLLTVYQARSNSALLTAGPEESQEKMLDTISHNPLLPVGVEDVLRQEHFPDYFGHFDNEGLKQHGPWAIRDMQGQTGVFYLGGSALFESIEGVLGVNEHVEELIKSSL